MKYRVLVGLNNVEWQIDEKRIASFLTKLENENMPYQVFEHSEKYSHLNQWYITFKNGDTRFCKSECEMYKTLYLTSKPVDCYGYIY